jgi:hypothetical protein
MLRSPGANASIAGTECFDDRIECFDPRGEFFAPWTECFGL